MCVITLGLIIFKLNKSNAEEVKPVAQFMEYKERENLKTDSDKINDIKNATNIMYEQLNMKIDNIILKLNENPNCNR